MLNTYMKAALAATGLFAMSGAANAAPDTFIGDLQATGTNFCPRGTMPAHGQLLPISQYTALFSLYGTNYGGDGRTTFGLPDLRGRIAVGESNTRRVGTRGGAEEGTLMVGNLPAHNHKINTAGSAATTGSTPVGHTVATLPAGVNAFSTDTTPNGQHMGGKMVGNTGGSQSYSVVAPSLGIKWCVTVEGVYPSRS